MKKSVSFHFLLFLSLLTTARGQEISGTLSCPAARPLDVTCLGNDALHPVPGIPYTYSVTVPAIPGVNSFRWIVTQDQTFLTNGTLNTANAESAGGVHIAAAGPELNATTASGEGESVEITWKTFTQDPDRPLFVVILVENTDGCTTQNLRVFKIEPKQVFTLDIANLRTDGTALEFGEELVSCVGGMVSASYDPAQENLVAYDYGTEYLFFAVTASGFSGSWQPEFELTGLTGTQSALIEWAYPATPAVWNAVNTPVTVQNQSGTVETSGECILVRVSLSHHSEEVLTAQQIQLAVDGTSGSLPDVHHADCSPDGFTHDLAVHTLKPRPAIQKL